MKKGMFAGVMFLLSTAANALPVTLDGFGQELDAGWFIAGPDIPHGQIGDDFFSNPAPIASGSVSYTNASGKSAFASSTTSLADSSLITSSSGLSFSATYTFDLSANVDAGYTDTFALVSGGMEVFGAGFTVDHPVYYNGSSTLMNAIGDSFDSGSVLQPGQYEVLDFGPFHFSHTVHAGESFSALFSKTFSYEFRAVAAEVPAPGALALLALGLAGVALLRHRAVARG